ncbi:MAG: hypothetical protein K1X89_20130 [Myxococcaceae bacterium]|nr:hypothetical protein [Myxococcaceae bacterium]
MKKTIVAMFAAAALAVTGCTSVESATVSGSDIVASGGEAMAVIQTSAIGLSFIFHIVSVVEADLDVVVNKLLVTEAKAMGASKVDLKGAGTTPKHGIFALMGNLVGFPSGAAVGVAVK